MEYVSHRENATHGKIGKGSSKYSGVSLHREKWQAQITINKKIKYLGCFTTELEASEAYQKALRENNIVNKYGQ